jgi:hypothetical protein
MHLSVQPRCTQLGLKNSQRSSPRFPLPSAIGNRRCRKLKGHSVRVPLFSFFFSLPSLFFYQRIVAGRYGMRRGSVMSIYKDNLKLLLLLLLLLNDF